MDARTKFGSFMCISREKDAYLKHRMQIKRILLKKEFYVKYLGTKSKARILQKKMDNIPEELMSAK